MKFVVDLAKCQDHAQCVFAAPEFFALNAEGKLAFRDVADEEYISGEIDDAHIDDVETAADICPVQAIRLEG
jgi:ferredoxin